MQDRATFADAFNLYLYGGEQVIKPEQLRPLDTTAIALPYGEDGKSVPVQKLRDVLKMVTAMTDDHAAYLILGIENQSQLHYAMPVRNMLYDSLQYSAQVDEIAKSHRNEKDKAETSEEFLSGFYRTDKLLPVITLTILWSGDRWTAPRSLFEMLSIQDGSLMKYMSDYKLNVLSPAELSDAELGKLTTELELAFKGVKYSNDADGLNELVHNDKRFTSVSKSTAIFYNKVLGTDIDVESEPEKEGYDVCKAIDVLMERSETKGRDEGINKGIIDTLAGLVKDGILSLAEAAKRANMTVSEFEDKTGLRA